MWSGCSSIHGWRRTVQILSLWRRSTARLLRSLRRRCRTALNSSPASPLWWVAHIWLIMQRPQFLQLAADLKKKKKYCIAWLSFEHVKITQQQQWKETKTSHLHVLNVHLVIQVNYFSPLCFKTTQIHWYSLWCPSDSCEVHAEEAVFQ